MIIVKANGAEIPALGLGTWRGALQPKVMMGLPACCARATQVRCSHRASTRPRGPSW